MLAKEPRFLHRFYGSSSEMMHGNKDDQFPAVGQSKIREKIKSLNFKDCHTKVCLAQDSKFRVAKPLGLSLELSVPIYGLNHK